MLNYKNRKMTYSVQFSARTYMQASICKMEIWKNARWRYEKTQDGDMKLQIDLKGWTSRYEYVFYDGFRTFSTSEIVVDNSPNRTRCLIGSDCNFIVVTYITLLYAFSALYSIVSTSARALYNQKLKLLWYTCMLKLVNGSNCETNCRRFS